MFLLLFFVFTWVDSDLSDDQIKRKMELCHQLLELAGVIEPGMSQFRGQLLFELQSAMENHARRMFRQYQLTRSQFKVFSFCSSTLMKDFILLLIGTMIAGKAGAVFSPF